MLDAVFYGYERKCAYDILDYVEDYAFEKWRPSKSSYPELKLKLELNPVYESYLKGGLFIPIDLEFYGLKGHASMMKRSQICKTNKFFRENRNALFDICFTEKYGTPENAIIQCDSNVKLWNVFSEWFQERREKFLDEMNVAIKEAKKTALANGNSRKSPQSHGGVANLLKVLTKTMEKQGSSIQTIAKVQYAVCIQAGIYIPDDFIRDVAVALDALDEK